MFLHHSLQDELEESAQRVVELSESVKGYSQREKQMQEINDQLEDNKRKNEKKIVELEKDNAQLRYDLLAGIPKRMVGRGRKGSFMAMFGGCTPMNIILFYDD